MDRSEEYYSHMSEKRIERTLMYVGLVLSGGFTSLYPSTVVTGQVGTIVTYCWSAAMISSAVACLYGAVTDKWIGEYSGLPLLASVLAFYSGALFLSAYDDNNLLVIAFGFILISFSLGLVARWRDIRQIKQQAEIQGNESKEG